MKRTTKSWLAVLLTVLLLLGTVAFGFSAAAEETDPYNWQPLPTSPEGLAEGDYYLNYTGGYYNYDIQDIYLETGPDAQWYVDEDAMVLKGPYWYPPSGFTYTLKPETKPISAKYLVYRYLTRVGENWERIGAFDTGKTVRGYRLDFTALAEQVIAENDALTTNDSPALVNMWEQGEWFVDLNSRQLKGCFAVPDCFSQVWEEAYQILLPSQENFDLCVTNAVPQAVDISSMQGQWNDNISWKLENGTLTISGTGKMESQKRNRSPVHTSLNYHRQTISFSSNSYTDRDLLSPFLDYFCLAYFGYADFDVLDADLALGKIDFAQVLDYYDYLFHLVKTLVIEEGITEIDGGILGNVFPETIILPTSLVRAGSTENYSRSAFSTNFTKDIYALNANLDFSTSSIPYCGFPLDHMPQSYDVLFNSYFEAGLSMMTAQQSDGITLYEDALKKICEIRAGKYENNYYDSSMTEANILADWNYKTGMDIPTTDALIAEGIRVINNLFGSAFATLDDIFEIEKTEYSVYAERSDAYDAVYSAYYNELLEELLAQNPDYAIYMTFDASNLGQPLPTSESETELVPFPWFTIHGYEGSTAEAAAAASGVRFVPITAAGTCGEHLTWVLENNTLTISGTGAMTDYSDSAPAPWTAYFAAPGAEITVMLEDGVTSIGANAFPASDGLKELIVLNRDCDLSALEIREPAFLRGYLGSTAEDYGNAHADESLFMPLCDVDYRHAADWKVEWDDEEDPDRHIEGVYCFVCSEYIYARFDAHEWSDWETVKEPTTEEEGEQTRTCSVCGKTETRTVEKLQPEGNGSNNNNNDDGGGFFGAIRRAMTAIVRWFKKLLSFFSK